MSSQAHHSARTLATSGRSTSGPSISDRLATALSTLASWKSWAVERAKGYAASLSSTGAYLAKTAGDYWRWLINPPTDFDMEEEDEEEDGSGSVKTSPPLEAATDPQQSPAADSNPGEVGAPPHQGLSLGETALDEKSQTLVAQLQSVLDNTTHPIPQDRATLTHLSDLWDTVQSLSTRNLAASRHYTDSQAAAAAYLEHIHDATNEVRSALERAEEGFRFGRSRRPGECLTCQMTKPMIQLSKRLLSDWCPRDQDEGINEENIRTIEHANHRRHIAPWRLSAPTGDEYDTAIALGIRDEATTKFEATQVFCGRETDALEPMSALTGWDSQQGLQEESIPREQNDIWQAIVWKLPRGAGQSNLPTEVTTFQGNRIGLTPVVEALTKWGTALHNNPSVVAGGIAGGDFGVLW
ncbi:hypothetical protein DB88DRAFT_524690 [Papiliotrema laurentii]|uniref:Uncharacterized protein n=1 Tax=Papiliotrema laurentii TaxID=5418 RepID=A0AAD9FR42_PAPLA|nr:hypothetical protein DB88DRAFT_524690 [Papiliotrema laurentii]